MKTQKLIRSWKGDKRFTEISKRAAKLKKSGHTPDEIVALLTEEFGGPLELTRLREAPQPLQVFGIIGADIEYGALQQLELALRLPIAERGALMPDAHPGYALPIGGVFAAHRAVAPAMVGVDIGCRMHLTLFAESPQEVQHRRTPLFSDLQQVTVFGSRGGRIRNADHQILDRNNWQATPLLRELHDKATYQIGTSGSGNHFAEIVVGERIGANGLPERFSGLLTHSGSRGVGYAIATYYMRVAAEETKRRAHVPKMYEWLDLDSEAGQEYWHAMHLAGDFAQANHEVIHAQFARRAGLTPLEVIQNHHNFAWLQGDSVLHRKGATPAESGVRGVIPGSMGTYSYVVEGRGAPEALASASHGAGRRWSRTQARDQISGSDMRSWMEAEDILVAGASVDEAPQAYKDIERVMEIQVEHGLIEPLARMKPIAVIMAGEAGRN